MVGLVGVPELAPNSPAGLADRPWPAIADLITGMSDEAIRQ